MNHRVLLPEELRQLHAVQREMLVVLDQLCRELGISYQIGAGTLLGAVRHGGFIPWDDDVDVVMLRRDYLRLLREAASRLPAGYLLQTWRSDPGFHSHYAKLRLVDSAFREAACADAPHHHGVYLDIFPFDYVQPNDWCWRLRFVLLSQVRRAFHITIRPSGVPLASGSPSWRHLLGQLVRPVLSHVPQSVWHRTMEWLERGSDRVRPAQVACLVSGSPTLVSVKVRVRSEEEFARTVWLPFEGLQLPATADYDRALTRLYGDYRTLPPEADRRPHHPVVEFRLPQRMPGAQESLGSDD